MYFEKRARGRKRAREEDGQVTEAGQREASSRVALVDPSAHEQLPEVSGLTRGPVPRRFGPRGTGSADGGRVVRHHRKEEFVRAVAAPNSCRK